MVDFLDSIRLNIRFFRSSHKICKWIFIKSHDFDIEYYGDIDIFVVVQNKENFFPVSKEVSKLSAQLTIELNKYVTIFPVWKDDYYGKKTQFLKNLHLKGIDL